VNEPRDAALQALYERDTAPSPPPHRLTGKAAGLVDGVVASLPDLDALIEDAATGWRLGRMPIVDRNILRLATFELTHRRDTPTGVILSEAVRLAKLYSTGRSGSFVNGVLASIAATVRPDEARR